MTVPATIGPLRHPDGARFLVEGLAGVIKTIQRAVHNDSRSGLAVWFRANRQIAVVVPFGITHSSRGNSRIRTS